MRASIVSSLVFLASTAQLASAGFSDALQFQCPGNTVNQCNSQQSSGFDWGTLGIGSFSAYGGFEFSGYSCANSFGKRDLLTGRSFQSKCITGTASYDDSSSSSFSCGSSLSAFSVTEFQISVEVDIDLEFHYGMSDGSVCKQKSSCKASGSTIQNTQCGGAKGVTVIIPKGSGNGKGCGYGIHSIGFDCHSTTSSVVHSTTLKTTTKTSTTQATTTSTTVAPAVTTSQTTTKCTTPGTTTSVPNSPELDTTSSPGTSTAPLNVPGTSSSTTAAGATTTSSTAAAGTTTSTAPSVAPSDSSSSTAPGTATTSSSVASSTAPGTTTTSSSVASGTTTTSSSVATSTAPGTTTAPSAAPTTSAGTTTAPSSTPSAADATSTSTIGAGSSGPATSDVSPPSSPPVASAPSSTVSPPPTTAPPALTTSTVFTTLVSTIISCGPEVTSCPGRSTVLTTVTVPLYTTVCPVANAATTAALPPPAQSESGSTCPDVLPRCLSTWMFSIGCSSNTDTNCFCGSSDYVNLVFGCISAHGSSDEEIFSAQVYFQGICAPYIPSNPAIVTGATTVTISAPVQTVPCTTIQVVTSIVVAVTSNAAGASIPTSSSTTVVSTVLTVPQVVFTTVASGASAAQVSLVPGTPAAVTVAAGKTASAGSAAATGPVAFTGSASRTSMGFGGVAAAVLFALAAM